MEVYTPFHEEACVLWFSSSFGSFWFKKKKSNEGSGENRRDREGVMEGREGVLVTVPKSKFPKPCNCITI